MTEYICDGCNKGFVSPSKLERHRPSCRGTLRKNECAVCHRVYASRQSLCNHKKKCIAPIVPVRLTFSAMLENGDIEFTTDHITPEQMQTIPSNLRPEIYFSKLAMLILQESKNQIVRKTGPNVNYSKILTENGDWELMIDDYIYPTLIHALSRSMLKVIDVERDPEFKTFLDSIETKNVEANVKLVVINLTKRKAISNE